MPNVVPSTFACLERAAMILGYFNWQALLRWRRCLEALHAFRLTSSPSKLCCHLAWQLDYLRVLWVRCFQAIHSLRWFFVCCIQISALLAP